MKHPQSVGQRAVRGHDPGVLPGRGRDDRGVPSTVDLQQGNRPCESCRGTGSRDRAGDEAIQLLDHGRWHAERSPGAVALDLLGERKALPDREQQRVRIEENARAAPRRRRATGG